MLSATKAGVCAIANTFRPSFPPGAVGEPLASRVTGHPPMLRRPNRSQTGGGLRNVSLSVQKHFVLLTDIWTWIIPFGSEVGRKKWPLRKPRSVHIQFVRAWQRRASTAASSASQWPIRRTSIVCARTPNAKATRSPSLHRCLKFHSEISEGET